MPLGIQPIHLIIVVIVALLIFGPSRLPEIGRGAGRAINEFRTSMKDLTAGLNEDVSKPAPAEPAAAPAGATASIKPDATAPIKPSPNVTCPQCKSTNPADAAFCNTCGTKLSSPCPQCQTINPADAAFCNKCGARLTTVASTPQATA